MKKILTILLMSFTCFVYAQTDKNIIHLTGSIVDGDSLKTIPFVHITTKDAHIGTVSDYYGYFSLIVHEGDTIEFSCIGYHNNQFILPDSMNEKSYSMIHIMLNKTILLEEFIVFPWPTFDQFKYAFINKNIPDKGNAAAKASISKEKLQAKKSSVPLEGSTTYKYELQNRYTQLYQGEGFPQYKILDPIAWSQFIKAWKNGDFKKK